MREIIVIIMVGSFIGICVLLFLMKGTKNFDEIANRPLDDDKLIDAERKEDKNE